MGGIANPRFRLLTGRDAPDLEARLATGRDALSVLDAHLADREFVVGERDRRSPTSRCSPTSACAGDAGVDCTPPHVAAWLERVRALPGFVDDFVTYPDNARPGARGRSTTRT